MPSRNTVTSIDVCAWDQGASGPKVCIDDVSGQGHKTVILPYYISQPRSIGQAASGFRINKAPQISLGGQTYCVGENALKWGEPIDSLDYQSMFSPSKIALFCTAFAQCRPPDNYILKMLTVGLPVQALKDAAEMQLITERAKIFKGQIMFDLDNTAYSLRAERVKFMAQPAGTLLNFALDDHFRGNRKDHKGTIAVMDLGRNSADFYAMSNFEVSPRFVGGEKTGVRRLLSKINDGRDVAELEAQLRAGRLHLTKPVLDSWLDEILGAMELIWPNPGKFSIVLPTGGGVLVLGDLLYKVLIAKGAVLHWPENKEAALLANAIGLWKGGHYALSH